MVGLAAAGDRRHIGGRNPDRTSRSIDHHVALADDRRPAPHRAEHPIGRRTVCAQLETWVLGPLWIGAALVAALWPGLTIRTLALLAGGALVASGMVRLGTALRGMREERLLFMLSGLAQLIFGALAIRLPAVTVLLLAVAFGIYLLVLGVRLVVSALSYRSMGSARQPVDRPNWPYLVRLMVATLGLVAALGALVLVGTVRGAQPALPGSFYTPPAPLPEEPAGTILRSELVPDFHPGATTRRVLYLSTGFDGTPAAVSGLIIVPGGPAPSEKRKVVLWTHGTVGVASNCGPSLIDGATYSAALPGLGAFMDAGYVVAAPDYQGLGTAGPHPYLVGASAGANSLDNVRAAINLPEAAAGADFVVWGESQGGHTALFSGQMAADYAPELNLRGVIASAPASDLVSLFKSKTEKADAVGNILVSMAMASWSIVYGVGLGEVVYPAAQPLVRSIAANCIQNPEQIQASIPAALVQNLIFIRNPPWEVAPWDRILAENTPGATAIGAPILIAQGSIDQVIAPEVQERFAATVCARGANVEYRVYPGIGHLTIAHDTESEMVAWINERFAGVPAESTCQ